MEVDWSKSKATKARVVVAEDMLTIEDKGSFWLIE